MSERRRDDRELALDALNHLASWRADDREPWVQVGMALQSVSPDLLEEWDQWSQQSEKYKPRECARQWRHFKADKGIALGTLIHMAQDDDPDWFRKRFPSKVSPGRARTAVGGLRVAGHAATDPSGTEQPPQGGAGGRKAGGSGLRVAGCTAPAPARSYETKEAAYKALLASIRKQCGEDWQLAHDFEYETVEGRELHVLRFEPEGGGAKEIRQASSARDGFWVLKRPEEKLCLYRHRELPDDGPVLVAEGEPAAEALLSVGMPATTSAGGAGAPARTDWSPLQGRDVTILPDNDEDGWKYAERVAGILGPSTSLRILELPDLDQKGDAADYVSDRRKEGVTAAEIRQEVEDLVADAQPFGPSADRSRSGPFPLHILPPEVQGLCKAIAQSRCVDVKVPAALSLVALGSAFGLTRMLHDKFADWSEPSTIWLAMSALSGLRKTPLINDSFAVFDDIQRDLHVQNKIELSKYEEALEKWQATKPKDRGPKPEKPKPLEHIYSTNATIEAVVKMLGSSPAGLLLIQDELSRFLGGFGKYSSGSGAAEAERGEWLSLFSARPLKSDRAGRDVIYTSRATVSVAGAIQPSVLSKQFTEEAYTSGLAPRFLQVGIPPQVKKYRQGPTREQRAAYEGLIRRLFEMRADGIGVDEAGDPVAEPIELDLSGGARELLGDFVPDWSMEGLAAGERIMAAMAKLEGYALRFALILRVVREARGEVADRHAPVDRQDVENGIALARWFRAEAEDVMRRLGHLPGPGEDEADQGNQGELEARAVALGARYPEGATPREWHKIDTRRPYSAARQELEELVQAGLAEWVDRPPGPRGGRPTRAVRTLAVTAGCVPLEAGQEVPGCGLRVAEQESGTSTPEALPPPCEPENGGDHPGNSESDRQPCNPQPTTHNPAEPDGTDPEEVIECRR